MPASICKPDATYGKRAIQKSPAEEKKRQIAVIGGHGKWLARVRWMWIELGSTLFHLEKKGKNQPLRLKTDRYGHTVLQMRKKLLTLGMRISTVMHPCLKSNKGLAPG